jgi:hypothetical protein
MIDLWNRLEPNFSSSKKSDVTLSEATLHWRNGKRSLGRKRNMISYLVLMLFLEYGTACNAKVCLTILKSFKYFTRN